MYSLLETIAKQLLQFLEFISLVTIISGSCRQIYFKFVLISSEWLRSWNLDRGADWFADVLVARRWDNWPISFIYEQMFVGRYGEGYITAMLTLLYQKAKR